MQRRLKKSVLSIGLVSLILASLLFCGCSSFRSYDAGTLDIAALNSLKGSNTIETVVFTDEVAPDDVDVADLTLENTAATVGWIDGSALYVSTQYSNASVVFPEDCSGMFYNQCTEPNLIDNAWLGLGSISATVVPDTSDVTDMSYMFHSTDIYGISGLSGWDTKNVVNMSQMFSNTYILDTSALSGWDTGNVIDVSYMFFNTVLYDVSGFENWDMSSAANMSGMFCETYLSHLEPLSSWNTSAATDMSGMFSSLTTLSDISALSSWDTSEVTNFSKMFYSCSELGDVSTLDAWTINSMADTSAMFDDTNVENFPSWYV